MRPPLLSLIACPVCQAELALVEGVEDHGQIWQGRLVCRHCATSYPIKAGMPYLYIDDVQWQPKKREADGWVKIHQEQGIYDQTEGGVDLQLPYYPEPPWLKVARSFDFALDQLQLSGTETILDLGAGRGWAAKQFALRGCRVVAVDIVPDEQVGLGRGQVLMENAGTYFDRLIADMENLPFQPHSFDLVFCCGTLHHSSHLDQLMSNIHRVLKPHGRLCAINEPCLSIFSNPQAELHRSAADELRLGINETRPTIPDYYHHLAAAGLKLLSAIPAHTYGMTEKDLAGYAQFVGAMPASFIWHTPLHSLWRLAHFHYHRLKSYGKTLPQLNQLPPDLTSTTTQLAYQILLWIDSELTLLAQKPFA